MMASGIRITESLATEIQKNQKAFHNLSFHEIFLFIEAFRETKIDPYAVYQALFNALFNGTLFFLTEFG